MANFNETILIGNLTRDPSMRHTKNGTPVTDISLAINEKRRTSNNDFVEDTTFIDVTLWSRLAEIAVDNFHKGDCIFVMGRLRLETWQAQDGQKRSKLKVIGRRIQRLSQRNRDNVE